MVSESRSHRDRVNAKVVKDPRVANWCNLKQMLFDFRRKVSGGSSGGSKSIVSA